MTLTISTLNPIYRIAVEKCAKDVSILPIIEALPESMQENAVKYLLGLINPDEEIPQTSEIAKDAVLESYDWLTDTVIYKYTQTDDRYFATVEEVEKFEKTGDYSYSKSNYRPDDEHPLKGSYNHTAHNNTSLKRWINQK